MGCFPLVTRHRPGRSQVDRQARGAGRAAQSPHVVVKDLNHEEPADARAPADVGDLAPRCRDVEPIRAVE
jgi:hypothetical protein